MSQEEARKLLEIWNWFDKHPNLDSYENIPREVFLYQIRIITKPFTGNDDSLSAAREVLGAIAAGKISGDMPTAIIEQIKAGNISEKEAPNIEKTTQLTKSWISKLQAKTSEEIVERQVAAAQVQAVVERFEEEKPGLGTLQKQKTVVPETKPPSEIKKVPIETPPSVPEEISLPPSAESPGFSFKIISEGSLPAASRLAAAPLRSIISFAFPTLASESSTQAAALSFVSAYGVSTKALEPLKPKALSLGISPEQFGKFIETISLYEQSLPQLIYQGREVDISPYQVEALFIQPGGDGVTALLPNAGFLGNTLRSAGQQIFGKISSNFVKNLIKGGAGKAAKTVAAAAAKVAPEVAVGAAAGPPGWLIAAADIAKDFLVKIGSKIAIWIKKHWQEIAGAILVGTGILVGGGVGLVVAIGGGLVALGGPGLKAVGSGIGNFFSFLTFGVLLPSLGLPFLVALIAIPVAIVIILFIINSGAYLVPPSGLVGENPYIGIEKVADPPGPFKSPPVSVSYTITITATKGTLSNIIFDYKCEVITKNSPPICPSVSISDSSGKSVAMGSQGDLTITPAEPYKLTYKTTYSGGAFQNSAIIDTLTVTADAPGQKGTKAEGSAAVIIGNPPTSCFAFDSSWTADAKNKEFAAIAELSKASVYMAKLCAAGPIPLRYENNGMEGGENKNGAIYIYKIYDLQTNLYTIAHESGHTFARRWPGVYGAFRNSVPGANSNLLCTYLFTPSSIPSENFAESIALYVSDAPGRTPQARFSCLGNSFKDGKYKAFWQFAKDNIFQQDLGW